MIEKTVAELSAALAAGETTSMALTQAYLEQIAAHNEALNAFITVCADSAMAQARAADEARAAGSTAIDSVLVASVLVVLPLLAVHYY